MATTDPQSVSWWRRAGWFVLLWAGGVAALGLVALLLRKAMAAVGMSL